LIAIMLVSEREKNADKINKTTSAISSIYNGMSSNRNASTQIEKIQDRKGKTSSKYELKVLVRLLVPGTTCC
jgi:phosphopantetheine adenylyltransferase